MRYLILILILTFSGEAFAKAPRSEYQKFMDNFRPSPEQLAAKKCRSRGGVWSNAFDCLSAGWPAGGTVLDEEQCTSRRAVWVSGKGYRCL